MNLDESFEVAKALFEEIQTNWDNILSEEDSKIQIIIRVLVEVLGWSHSDLGAERKHDNGYSDLIVSVNGKSSFVLEAKKKGILDLKITDKSKSRILKLSGPALSGVMSGVDQAAGYATPKGMNLAVLTDGNTWIVFKTYIVSEDFKEKEALVFPSISSILNDFVTFYELISKDDWIKKTYMRIFDKIHNNRVFLQEPLVAPFRPDELKLVKKSDLAFDIDRIFDNFFARLKGEDDPDLLIECFVETRESRIADFSLEKITANVLGNIAPKDKGIEVALELLIRDAVEVDEGQSIFIVGPTGAGKTTFLDRFFRKTLPPALRDRCIVSRVNFLNASGDAGSLLRWMTEQLISSLEAQLFERGIPTYDQLRGLYHVEYVRRSEGTQAKLYIRSKEEFQEEFGKYMENQVEIDREGYLRRLIADSVHNRRKLPVMIVDNTDEFTQDYKKIVFQFFQALRRHAKHCLVIFPVTDKSAWSFSKTDLYGIYQTRSFFLPTPPPREVFRRRIDYIKKKSSMSNPERRKYFTERGIKVSIENIGRFCDILEDVFVNHEYTSKTIGELSNYNIRRTLTLSRRVITSSFFKVADLITSYATGEAVATSYAKFMQALLRGDYELYKQGDASEVYPIYQTDSKIQQSPLIFVRILALLDTVSSSGKSIDEKHISIVSISEFFEACGCSEAAVDSALITLLDNNLIEPFDPSIRDLAPSQSFSITFAGRCHLNLALYNVPFFTQMAFTTAINDADLARQIRSIFLSNDSFSSRASKARDLFAEYLIRTDRSYVRVPQEGGQYDRQRKITDLITRFRIVEKQSFSSGNDTLVDTVQVHPTELLGVLAKVDWFDVRKGFGFADVEGVEGQVYFNSDVGRSPHIDRISDGDDLLCDIRWTPKGPQIAFVHDLQVDETDLKIVDCEIVRLFAERSYGFVRIRDSQEDAFFHFSIIPEQLLSNLQEGNELKVEVRFDERGGFQVRRVLQDD